MTSDKVLARAVVNAATIREKSYDHKASRAADRAQDKKRAEAIKSGISEHRVFGFVDYSTFYRKTLRQAAEEATKRHKRLAQPVYLLLVYAWNDSLDWAEEILNIKRRR